MSCMGKARKIFNKNPGFPPYLFDKTQLSGPRSVPAGTTGKNIRRFWPHQTGTEEILRRECSTE